MPRKITIGNPLRVVGYIRASTEEQSLGPAAQLSAMERWCKAAGAELVKVHQDLGVSGGLELDKRPALLAALDSLRVEGAGVLLVAKRDRLARDVIIAAMVERLARKAGAQVQAADGTANGDGPEAQLQRRMFDAFAEYERALIRARTRAALAVKRSRKERTGAVPFGYRVAEDGVHLEQQQDEQAALAQVLALRTQRLSIRAIAQRLGEQGVRARGSRWHPTTVARLLARGSAA
jgi:site-specific DNA recombinase